MRERGGEGEKKQEDIQNPTKVKNDGDIRLDSLSVQFFNTYRFFFGVVFDTEKFFTNGHTRKKNEG